jgi:hypothetical protein
MTFSFLRHFPLSSSLNLSFKTFSYKPTNSTLSSSKSATLTKMGIRSLSKQKMTMKSLSSPIRTKSSTLRSKSPMSIGENSKKTKKSKFKKTKKSKFKKTMKKNPEMLLNKETNHPLTKEIYPVHLVKKRVTKSFINQNQSFRKIKDLAKIKFIKLKPQNKLN